MKNLAGRYRIEILKMQNIITENRLLSKFYLIEIR